MLLSGSSSRALAALAVCALMAWPSVAGAQRALECNGERYLGARLVWVDETEGWWLPRSLFDCFVVQADNLRLRSELLAEQTRELRAGAREWRNAARASQAAESRTGDALLSVARHAEELQDELGAWYRAPWLWAAVGAVGALLLGGVAVWVVGTLG